MHRQGLGGEPHRCNDVREGIDRALLQPTEERDSVPVVACNGKQNPTNDGARIDARVHRVDRDALWDSTQQRMLERTYAPYPRQEAGMRIQGHDRGKLQQLWRNDSGSSEHEYIGSSPNERTMRPVVGERIDDDDAPRDASESPPRPPPGATSGTGAIDAGPKLPVGGTTRRVLLYCNDQDIQDDPRRIKSAKDAVAERMP